MSDTKSITELPDSKRKSLFEPVEDNLEKTLQNAAIEEAKKKEEEERKKEVGDIATLGEIRRTYL